MKYTLLALLAKGPAHGYELKQAFEDLFGAAVGTLNAGQVYTTLSRLGRDDLVCDHHVEQAGRPDKRVYEITAAGQAAVAAWLTEPVAGPRLKDEFFMKLMLAAETGVADPGELIERQRHTYLRMLRDLNDMALDSTDGSNLSTSLLIKGAILHVKADLEWLDLCEEQLS
jgi:DNA-binding PadR family transcriptional regulator